MHTLRTTSRAVFVVAGLLAALLLPLLGQPQPAVAASGHQASEQFLTLMNASRRAKGRTALVASPAAAKIARKWSKRMAADGDLRHNPRVSDQLTVSWRRWGENVGWASNHAGAALSTVVRRLHRRFMASDGHRANVLGDYNQVGVGVAVDTDGTIWATMVFVDGPLSHRSTRRTNAAPAVLTDIAGNVHRAAITTATRRGLIARCAQRRFCPRRVVGRAEMAATVARMRDLPHSDTHHFDDVKPGPNAIAALADAGVIVGCARRRFCPGSPVTRAQLATILVRALPRLEPSEGDRFVDLPAGYVHTPAISALAAAGVTRGCAARRFCPTGRVTRGQLASLVMRALDN